MIASRASRCRGATVRCQSSSLQPQKLAGGQQLATRRSIVAAPLMLSVFAAAPALAYGGRKEIQSLDAGGGNSEYDRMMAIIRQRQQEQRDREAAAKKETEAPSADNKVSTEQAKTTTQEEKAAAEPVESTTAADKAVAEPSETTSGEQAAAEEAETATEEEQAASEEAETTAEEEQAAAEETAETD